MIFRKPTQLGQRRRRKVFKKNKVFRKPTRWDEEEEGFSEKIRFQYEEQ